MKLLNCLECHDIFAISKEPARCHCEKSFGLYIDDIHVQYKGPCRILGIGNTDYKKSLAVDTTLDEWGFSTPKFNWFVIVEGQHIQRVA